MGFIKRLTQALRGKPDAPPPEPLFVATPRDDAAMRNAYADAAATIPYFLEQVETAKPWTCSAKLRFRDPDESERLGEDRFVFLWLAGVTYHRTEDALSGVFVELPPQFAAYHQIGERIAFRADEIFDWMILEDGHLQGGYTLRVIRERLPPEQRAAYDRHIGVTRYEPVR